MTTEQLKLVDENHNLIYYYINKNLDGNIEDWYGIIAIALCKAAINFDKSKGTFATYAIRCMENEYRMEIRKLNTDSRKCDRNAISLDITVTEDGDCTLGDIVADKSIKLEEGCMTIVDMQRLLDSMSERDKNVILLTLLGYNQQEIAKEKGISQGCISKIIKRFKDKL